MSRVSIQQGLSFAYPVILQHLCVFLREVLAVLEAIDTLYTVALLQTVADYACLHSTNPGLPNNSVALLQPLYEASQLDCLV